MFFGDNVLLLVKKVDSVNLRLNGSGIWRSNDALRVTGVVSKPKQSEVNKDRGQVPTG